MKATNCLQLLALFFLASCSTAPQQFDPMPVHDTFTIQSERVGELRTMNVWTPPEYAASTDSLPVLYMPDGGLKEDFPHVANTIAELVKAGKIRPVILVGIENTERRRDLTGPTVVEKDKEIAPVVGGAENFRAFLNTELFPEVGRRYRTTPEKGILGESLAGLFVTETFLLRPGMFDFYIAFDPSLWWNDKYLIRTAGEQLAKFPDAQKQFWFAGSGAEDVDATVGMLAKTIEAKKPASLTWSYSPEPKEGHATIFRATKEKSLIWSLGTAKQE